MQLELSRRRFLALSSAAALGATFFDAPRVLSAAGLTKADDPYSGFPLGVQSYSLRNFDALEAIRHIQGLGVHYAEFYSKHLDPGASPEKIEETKKLLEKAEIALAGHGVHGFTKNHEANRKLFEFARRAGVRTITANPERDSFESLEKLVQEFDIRIAIHNHGPGALYDSIDSVKKAVEGRHKLIGACVDCGHFLRSKEDPVKAVLELGPRVFAAHVKDDIKEGRESHNVVIGKGKLDVLGLFKALKQVKFPSDGCLSLEYEANPANPIDDMKECLAVAREAIARLGA